MKLLIDENGHAVLEDGLPVYEYEDGSKSPFNAKVTLDNLNKKISNVTEESTRHFTKFEKLKKDFKVYKNIDPVAALDALETVKNLKTKDLLDSNGVKLLKADLLKDKQKDIDKLKKSHSEELATEREVNLALRNTMKYQAIKTEFSNSKFFSGKTPKTIFPANDAVKIFGHNFDVEDAGNGELRVFARDKDGTPMMSQTNQGSTADFDEAMAKIIDSRSDSVDILNPSPGGPLAKGNLGPGKPGEYASSVDRIAAGLKSQHPDKFM